MRESFWDRFRNVVPSRYDDPDVRLFKLLVLAFFGALFLMTVAGLTTFLVSLRGAEETMVPNLVNQSLLDGTLALQERGLNARVETRFSADPRLANQVISQSPPAGTLIRAGKHVDLVVSRGARVDRIGAYVGRSITEVRAELRALFATGDQTIEIGEVSYVFSDQDAGTVLAQDPPAGTEIASIVSVALVVSRGQDVERVELPSVVGLPFDQAVDRLVQNAIPFRFTVRDAGADERSGHVVAQDPPAGEAVERGSFVDVTMTRPAVVPDGQVFGLLERSLPQYAVDVELTLEAQTLVGEREVLFSMLHPGRGLSVPYQVAENTALVLYRSGQEIYRVIARRPVDAPAAVDPESSGD